MCWLIGDCRAAIMATRNSRRRGLGRGAALPSIVLGAIGSAAGCTRHFRPQRAGIGHIDVGTRFDVTNLLPRDRSYWLTSYGAAQIRYRVMPEDKTLTRRCPQPRSSGHAQRVAQSFDRQPAKVSWATRQPPPTRASSR